MSVRVLSRLSLLLVVSALLIFGVATLASAGCGRGGSGDSGWAGCPPKEIPDRNYNDAEEDPRGTPINEADLWQKYCVDRYPDYDGDPETGPWDNDPESLNNFYYDTGPLPDYYVDEMNLNPTGVYVWVWAVCGGPDWERNRDQYGYGPQGANFANWVVAEVEPIPLEDLPGLVLPDILSEVQAKTVQPGEMAPPADAAVVNTKTWLWVENDFEDFVYDEETRGTLTVWVQAEPTYTVFDVDGEQIARCEGPGTPYTGGPLSAETDCFHDGFDEASYGGPFEGTVTIEWVFHWGVGDDYYGEFHTYDATTDLEWTVDEVFSTETG